MKQTAILALTTFVLLTGCHWQKVSDSLQSINPVIGDISFVKKYGVLPDQTTDENLRIRTHLEYVEKHLRQKDITNLTVDLKKKREKLLDLLHEYRLAGKFPKNYDYADQRKPCFIDKDGNICAVGYLVQQTVGQETAEKINALYKYASIPDMKSPDLAEWVASSGLTLKECAMIQPTYISPPDNHIEPAYGITSSVLSGTNFSLITLNAVQMQNPGRSNTIPVLGLISGTGQIALGIIKFPPDRQTVVGLLTNEYQKAVSMVNIGIGTSTIILSGYHLLLNRKARKRKTTAWNLYSYPTAKKEMGIGLTFMKQF